MSELVLSILIGAALGSFLTMLTYRLPQDLDIIFKPSHCVKCKQSLKWYNLLPIISFILQGGKCSKCGQVINNRYLIIEVISVLIFAFCAVYYPYNQWFYAILYWCLLGMIVTDLENLIVPDFLQIIFLLCGFYYIFAVGFFDLAQQLLYSLGIGLFLIILAKTFQKIRKIEGIGFADIKFFAISGLFFNIYEIALLFFLSGLVGIIFGLWWKKKHSQREFPFIPCIIISFVIILNKLIYFSSL